MRPMAEQKTKINRAQSLVGAFSFTTIRCWSIFKMPLSQSFIGRLSRKPCVVFFDSFSTRLNELLIIIIVDDIWEEMFRVKFIATKCREIYVDFVDFGATMLADKSLRP